MRADATFGPVAGFLLTLGAFGGAAPAQTCTATDTAVTAANPDDAAALAGDCAVLLGLKDQLNGTSTLNWARSLSMASWDGITLGDAVIRVEEVRLRKRGVAGSLPDLSSLIRLRVLDLSENALDGSIFSARLPKSLEVLHFYKNELTGSIPDLSAFGSLTNLNLARNELSGNIPSTLNALTSLVSLDLGSNRLTGSIPDLSDLRALGRFDASFNKLTGGVSISNFSVNLANLVLAGNDLSGPLPDMSAFTGLKTLHLSHNDFSGNIDGAQLPGSLLRLHLSGNRLSGSIPDLSHLASLQSLDLDYNELSGRIPDLSALTSLQRLSLHYNELSGAIPDLSALTSLQQLSLHYNELSGAIPDLSALKALRQLTLFENKLSGDVPDLSGLASLQVAYLHRNWLWGIIPDLNDLPSLQRLWLHENWLSGGIPDLSGLTGLRQLTLHKNQLRGSVPRTLGALVRLTHLHLAMNELTGGIPGELGALTSLRNLSLCGNDLDSTATLPAALETRRTANPPTLRVWSCLRVEDAAATEGQSLRFPLEHSTFPVRGGPGAADLAVRCETRDGTALAGADFVNTAENHQFDETIPGNTDVSTTTSTATVEIPTVVDGVIEGDETLTLRVFGQPSTVFLRSALATGTISDATPLLLPPPPPPVASFTITPADCSEELCTVLAGSRVTLRDTSTGTVDGLFWDLGDGGTSTRPVFQHSWKVPGYYEVTLTVTGAGATSAAARTVLVKSPPPPSASFTITPADCSEELCVVFAGSRVTLRDTSTGTVDGLFWDLGDGGTSTRPVFQHSWEAPGYYEVTLTVTGASATSEATRTVLARPPPAEREGACEPDAETLCLLNERFSVKMDWWTSLHGGERGRGKVAYRGTNDSGLFRFFDLSNWEVLIKALDGCAINRHVWVYGASATTLAYSIRVTDTVTDAVSEYTNEDGVRAEAIVDSRAFAGICDPASPGPPAALPAADAPAAADAPFAVVDRLAEGAGCVETETTLCLLEGRYEVSASWSTLDGEEGRGLVLRPRTGDSGLFHFFESSNWEMLVKVLDGCWYNGRHWVFAASATDLGLDLVVRDTVTGMVKRYVKDPGTPAPAIADTGAFPEGCKPPGR